jgi:hypothetical protein
VILIGSSKHDWKRKLLAGPATQSAGRLGIYPISKELKQELKAGFRGVAELKQELKPRFRGIAGAEAVSSHRCIVR